MTNQTGGKSIKTMADLFPEQVPADFNPADHESRTIHIIHSVGSWPVTIHSSYWTVPDGLVLYGKDEGFKYVGQASAYLRRLAKSQPDQSSHFYIVPWTDTNTGETRHTIHIGRQGGK